MNIETEALLQAFDRLSAEEQQYVTSEILRRCVTFDSGPISDEEIGQSAAVIGALLEDSYNS